MNRERRRRLIAAALVSLAAVCGALFSVANHQQPTGTSPVSSSGTQSTTQQVTSSPATDALTKLTIKGRAAKTGYSRAQFGDGWQQLGGCDVRNHILARDMTDVTFKSATDCTVESGTLLDPYTLKTIHFKRGPDSSAQVQIDHVVALSDAWQKGAQQLVMPLRIKLANDPLNLLAVDGPTNNNKGDADAATWLPPNKDYRCRYVARQIAVKTRYTLWITQAEHDAMADVLGTCAGQLLPVTEETSSALPAPVPVP